MNTYDYVGVDIAKEKFDACVEFNGKFYHEVFENKRLGFKKFLKWLNKYVSTPWVCFEATGKYGELLAEYLCEASVQVSIVNPMQIKNYAKAILSRNKNDNLDAKVILQYSKAATSLQVFKPSSAEKKELRESVQLIEMLGAQRDQLNNQLESSRCRSVKAELKKAIKVLKMRIVRVEKRLQALVEKDEELKAQKVKFTSVKGIADTTAYRLMAYLPDLSQFSSAKQLAAYAGLSPRQFQSGAFAGQTKLSKFGNARLRKCLYMSALVAKNRNPHLQKFCQRLEQNGLKPKQIICAVMRKLLHIIFGMCKNNTDFNSELV